MVTAVPRVGRRVEFRTAAITGPRGAPGVAGGSAVVKEAGSVVSSAATTFDFGAGFDVTESPAGEVNIAIDLTEVPAASDTAQGPVELATVAEATMGTDTVRATTPAGVKAAIAQAIADLNQRLGLPPGLKSMGVPKEALSAIAEAAPKDHCHGTNPRKATVAEYLAILEASWI